MGLFRRKPKEKRINKKLVITLEILGAVLLFGILLGIKWLKTNHDPYAGAIKFDDQVVANINFIDARLEKKDKTYEFIAKAVNYTEKAITLPDFEVRFYSEDNTHITDVKVAGSEIAPSGEYEIKANIPTDIAKPASSEIVVE